jgi:hypothetical protein
MSERQQRWIIVTSYTKLQEYKNEISFCGITGNVIKEDYQ